MLTVAHRAGNDLADLRAALDAGVDLVEADVQLFGNELEMRHSRTFGRPLIWEAKPFKVYRRRTAVPPLLLDVLQVARDDPRFMLDLKGSAPALAPKVADLLRRVVPGRQVTVCTKDWRMLDAFRAEPNVRLVHSAGTRRELGRLRRVVRQRPGYGVSIRLSLLTEPLVAELLRSVSQVMAWSVDTPEMLARARQVGATAVISKSLPLLREVMAT